MSLVTKTAHFCVPSNHRYLVLDTDPEIMEAIEKVSVLLGATKVPNETYAYSFNSYRALEVLEEIWRYLKDLPNKNCIVINYNDQSLHLASDGEDFKVFLALVATITHRSLTEEPIFLRRQCEFFALYDVAEALGLLPS